MALLRGKLNDIPPDAVVLTQREAYEYQRKTLENWSRESDVFAFKYGRTFLAMCSGFAGTFINGYYRNKFKLLSYGRVSSYLPIFVIPSAFSFLFHNDFVLPDVVLQKSCTVCTELRASALQAFSGSVVPSILAPLSALSLATRYATVQVPFITKEPMKVFQLWKTKTLPFGNVLFGIFLAQAFVASVVTHFEAKSVETCNNILIKVEEEKQKMLEMR